MPSLRSLCSSNSCKLRDSVTRPLDVRTTSAANKMGTGLPKLSISSQAFAHPPGHNLCDSPADSPSNSPPPPTPISPASSTRYSPFSSVLDSPLTPYPPLGPTTMAKSKTAGDGRVKRPQNAFILFRRHRCREKQEEASSLRGPDGKPKSKPRQAELSKLISAEWKNLPPHERSYWELLAKEKKEAHAQEFPGYQYRPRRPRSAEPPPSGWSPDLMLPPQPERPQESNEAIKIILPFRSADSSSIPSEHYAYQEIVVPNIPTPSQGITSASVWEKYQSTLSGMKLPPQPQSISPSLFPPVPMTPHLQQRLHQNLDSDSPALTLSPISFTLDSPLMYPPLPSDHLASPFQETVKMPTYHTPAQDGWLWQSPTQTVVNPEDMDLSFAAPSDLGIFEKIDYGFAGDYTESGGH